MVGLLICFIKTFSVNLLSYLTQNGKCVKILLIFVLDYLVAKLPYMKEKSTYYTAHFKA